MMMQRHNIIFNFKNRPLQDGENRIYIGAVVLQKIVETFVKYILRFFAEMHTIIYHKYKPNTEDFFSKSP